MSSIDEEIEEIQKKLESLKNKKKEQDYELYDRKYKEYLVNKENYEKKIEKIKTKLKNEKEEIDQLGRNFPEKMKEHDDEIMVQQIIDTFPELVEDPDKSSLIVMYNQKNNDFQYGILETVFKIDKKLGDIDIYDELESCKYFESGEFEYKTRSIDDDDYDKRLYYWIASCQERKDMPKNWPKNIGILDHYHYFPQVDEGEGWNDNDEEHDFSIKFWK